MNIPYNSTDFAFTLDDSKFLDISTANENTFFTLQLVIRSYNFFDTNEIVSELNYKIPLFQKAAKFNIGRIIHREMSNLNELNSSELPYKTALVKITLQEFAFTDEETVVSEIIVDNIQFIAGLLPNLKLGNFAILTSNTNASRVTPLGFFNVTFLLPVGTHQLELLLNNTAVLTETVEITALNNIITKKVKAETYNANPGDVFSYTIKTKALAKQVVVFPKQLKSNHLLFINEFKLLDSLECTGVFNFDINYNQIKHKYKRDLVEITEVIETKNENAFTINTGWILKTDNITVDSIMRSKKAWLFINESETIEMVPIPKKIENLNSDQPLYSFELEFTINNSVNAQNYTL